MRENRRNQKGKKGQLNQHGTIHAYTHTHILTHSHKHLNAHTHAFLFVCLFVCLFSVINPDTVKPLGLRPPTALGTTVFQGGLALALKPLRNTPSPNWGNLKQSTS